MTSKNRLSQSHHTIENDKDKDEDEDNDTSRLLPLGPHGYRTITTINRLSQSQSQNDEDDDDIKQ